MLNRRDVLNLAVSAGTAATIFSPRGRTVGDEPASWQIVDTNVSLFRWPFRRLPLDDRDALVQKLHALGIVQAWAGSFEAILHRDITGVNQRLAEACRDYAELIPVGSVNPMLPGWQKDLRRCAEDYNMPGIRLHPNYHRYTLDGPMFHQLLDLSTAAGLFVQIAVAMEDTRTQHHLLPMPDVNLTPLSHAMAEQPGARVQILNHRGPASAFEKLSQMPGVFFDTARIDGTDGVPKLLEGVPPDRVLFGSHAPFLIPEAALIRVHESGLLDTATLKAILSENAERGLGKGIA